MNSQPRVIEGVHHRILRKIKERFGDDPHGFDDSTIGEACLIVAACVEEYKAEGGTEGLHCPECGGEFTFGFVFDKEQSMLMLAAKCDGGKHRETSTLLN